MNIYNEEILTPFIGRLASYISWVSDLDDHTNIEESEEFYLRAIKRSEDQVYLILEGRAYQEKCGGCPLLDNEEFKNEYLETLLIPLWRVREIRFYQEGV